MARRVRACACNDLRAAACALDGSFDYPRVLFVRKRRALPRGSAGDEPCDASSDLNVDEPVERFPIDRLIRRLAKGRHERGVRSFESKRHGDF